VARRKVGAKRDIEEDQPANQFIAKLRRLADCIEHERGATGQEIEFRLKWPLDRL